MTDQLPSRDEMQRAIQRVFPGFNDFLIVAEAWATLAVAGLATAYLNGRDRDPGESDEDWRLRLMEAWLGDNPELHQMLITQHDQQAVLDHIQVLQLAADLYAAVTKTAWWFDRKE